MDRRREENSDTAPSDVPLSAYVEGLNSVPPYMVSSHIVQQILGSILHSMDQLMQHNAQLLEEAGTDHLTGLLNRRGFEQRAIEATHSPDPYGILFADVDHVHEMNANIGHSGGDLFLRYLGSSIKHALRPQDSLTGRHGGDEFLALLNLTPREDQNGPMPHAQLSPRERLFAAASRARTFVSLLAPVIEYNDKFSDAPTGIKVYGAVYEPGMDLTKWIHDADPKCVDEDRRAPLLEGYTTTASHPDKALENELLEVIAAA